MRHFLIGCAVLLIGWWVWGYFFPANTQLLPPNLPSAQLSEAEIVYYQQVYDYTMAVTKPDEPYAWQTYSSEGSITAGKIFVSKSGATCRNFSEQFRVNEVKGTAEGVACKRDGKEGWCRLKTADALTCAMESPANIIEGVGKSVKDGVVAAKDMMVKAWGAVR